MTKPSCKEVKGGAEYYGNGARITYDTRTKEYVISGINYYGVQFERRYDKFKVAKLILKQL